jgi:hypothetical protein
MKLTKAKQAEREQAIKALRELLPPGSTVQTILRHVSKSGMMRHISPVIDGRDESYRVALIVGETLSADGYVKVGGCGMDLGFDLVYRLSCSLYREGFTCVGNADGNRCPSNDHGNGDADYTPHQHKSGGYALRQRWL